MDRELWKYIATLNMAVLCLVGMVIHGYLRLNYIDWYYSHIFIGSIANLSGIAIWIIWIVKSSTYLHSKSKVTDHVQTS